MKKKIFILWLFILVVACKGSFHGRINEESTREVLDHHWEAFINNNLDAVMEDYTEESVLILPDGTHEGVEEIRKVFIGAFKSYPQDDTSFNLIRSVVEKDVAYIIWKADAPNFILEYGTDTFLVQDGKIVRQTFAGVTSPRE